MKIHLNMIRYTEIATLYIILSIASFAFAKDQLDLIEHLRVVTVESMEYVPVQEESVHYLNVIIQVKNENEQDLELIENDFELAIYKKDIGRNDVGIAACISNLDQDKQPSNIACSATKENIRLPSQQSVRVLLSFELGRKRPIQETLADILSCIGKPTEDHIFLIEGRFKIMIGSEQNSSYGEAVRVEWGFCPDIQNELPLHECLVE